MSLSNQDIDAVREALALEAGAKIGDLRARFPNLRWAACDARDVDDDPLFSAGGYDVHLLDAREHCVGLTADPAEANGFMLAMREASS